jgi:hypothetical protein
MSYRTSFEIKELKLRIPKEEFPLKSDMIVGFEFPRLLLEEDENSYDENAGKVTDEYVEWNLTHAGQGLNGMWLVKLEELCIKYGGTLIMDTVGEDGEVEYIRIREGKKKNVKIVEED